MKLNTNKQTKALNKCKQIITVSKINKEVLQAIKRTIKISIIGRSIEYQKIQSNSKLIKFATFHIHSYQYLSVVNGCLGVSQTNYWYCITNQQ